MGHERRHYDASEPAAAAAAWLLAMVLFAALAIAMLLALFAWAPWEDDTIGGGGGTDTQQQGDTEINIDGNTDVRPGTSPAASP